MTKSIISTILLFIGLNSFAQDDIKIMQYNLLNYGNITSYCTVTNNNMADKEVYLREIINYVQPDIFTVNEIAANTYVTGRLLDSVMNYQSNTYGKSDYVKTNGSDLVNMLYYNKSKFTYIGSESLQNEVRDIALYKLYYNSPNLAQTNDTVFLNCIVAHLKAGNTSSSRTKRASMINTAMSYLVQHNYHGNYLFMGDFNLYKSSEPAYQSLINYSNSTYKFNDPINTSGNWNNNSSFAAIHTQSTHTNSNGCASGGGLDDRFDFILISNDIKNANNHIHYKNNSYTVIGNDGNHFNKSITNGTNNSVPANILNTLYNMSDHLPITLELHLDDLVSSIDNFDGKKFKVYYQNPINDNVDLYFETDFSDHFTIELWSINGTKLIQKEVEVKDNTHIKLLTNSLSSGMYIMRILDFKGISRYNSKLIKY
ncbi:MAG: hypothetical protein DRI86_09725 [Bacteroidetes bacterium]|nr:MAG: hypothetical protein DRI86_09725 [Bacteroidota bacterium]